MKALDHFFQPLEKEQRPLITCKASILLLEAFQFLFEAPAAAAVLSLLNPEIGTLSLALETALAADLGVKFNPETETDIAGF